MTDAWISVKEALFDLDFPATKQNIVEHVRQRGVDERALKLVRGLPPETYRNISEVRSGVQLNMAADEGVTPSDKALKAREGNLHPHRQLVAEHLRDTE